MRKKVTWGPFSDSVSPDYPDPFVDLEAREAAANASDGDLVAALRAEYEATEDAYDGRRLRVGADLRPAGSGCDRETVYRLNGVARDPLPLRKLAMLREGKDEEVRLVRALVRAGETVETQVVVHPLRPSFWAWAPGHADVLRVERRHLVEVKVIDDARRPVSDAHRYQLSFYFHELRRQGRADRASWLYVDRRHESDPVEVPLTERLLVPLADLVAVEEAKAPLLARGLDALPPRPAGTIVVEVLKGPRRKPPFERVVRARRERYRWCRWCAFAETCQPGPETTPLDIASVREVFVASAEAAWAAGDERTPQVTRLDAALAPADTGGW